MRLAFFVLFTTLSTFALAQNIEFSPLSRYGFGDLTPFKPAGLIGFSSDNVAFTDEGLCNPSNPASYAFLRLTAAELGIHAKYKKVKDQAGLTADDWSGNMDHITLGIPFRNSINDILDHKTEPKAWAMAIGLNPYSATGYQYTVNDSNAAVGKTKRQLLGYGSINRFFLGLAFRKNNLSFGLNAAYLFGSQNYEQSYSFQDIEGAADNFNNDKIHSSGFQWTAGVLYQKTLNQSAIKNDKTIKPVHLNIGLTFDLPTKIKQTYDALYITRFDLDPNAVIDTVKFIEDNVEKIKLPLGIKFAAYYDFKEKYGFAFQFAESIWQNASLHSQQKVELKNQNIVSVGTWWRPSVSGYGNGFKRAKYGFGISAGNDYRSLNAEIAKQFSASLGMSIPVIFQRQGSYVHLGIEAGVLDVPTLYKDNYIRFNLAFTLDDNEWFLKRRYD